MVDRPLGVDGPERDFPVSSVIPLLPEENQTKKEKLREWFFYVKNFSFNRGSVIELELSDEDIELMQKLGWIRFRNDSFFFTRRGSNMLSTLVKEKSDSFLAKEQSND